MEKQKMNLEEYLMRQLTAYDWCYPVQRGLGWTKMRLGKHVAYPQEMPFDRVIELAQYLEEISDTPVTHRTLVNVLFTSYNCGSNKIKMTDYEKWIK